MSMIQMIGCAAAVLLFWFGISMMVMELFKKSHKSDWWVVAGVLLFIVGAATPIVVLWWRFS